MPSLQYAGSSSDSDNNNLATKYTVDTEIKDVKPNRESIKTDVNTAIGALATKDDVDKQDLRFAPIKEYGDKDAARNVAKKTLNTPNGPVSTPIPASRFPVLGDGYVMGPYGWQEVSEAKESNGSAVQIATLTTAAIPSGQKFWPVAFGQVLVTADDVAVLPLIEIRSGGGVLLAMGKGRTMFIGGQGISVMPVGGADWPTSNGGPLVVNMFLSDFNGRKVTAAENRRTAISGAVYIMLAS